MGEKVASVNKDLKLGTTRTPRRSISHLHRAKYTLLCKVSHSQLSLMQRKPNFDLKINKVNGP